MMIMKLINDLREKQTIVIISNWQIKAKKCTRYGRIRLHTRHCPRPHSLTQDLCFRSSSKTIELSAEHLRPRHHGGGTSPRPPQHARGRWGRAAHRSRPGGVAFPTQHSSAFRHALVLAAGLHLPLQRLVFGARHAMPRFWCLCFMSVIVLSLGHCL